MNSYLRKWGVATTINFELFAVDGVDLYITANDGGTDCNIRKDQGADATCANDFVDEGIGYSLALTATEMEAAEVTIYVIDSATKLYLDTAMKIETYGNASAQHAFDLDTASVAQSADNDTLAAGATGFAAINTDVETILARIIGTLATGTHTAQTGDTYALLNSADSEPAQGTPVHTASLAVKIATIFKFLVNKKTATSTELAVYNSVTETTVDHKSTISEVTGTYTEGEWIAGP